MVWTPSGRRRPSGGHLQRAQRPTLGQTSRPRPTTRPTRPGPDRTQRQWVMPAFGQPEPRPAPGPAHHDHPHPMLDAGTSATLAPVRCPCGSIRRPQWTPRSDSLPDTACRSYPAGHHPLHPARPADRKLCGHGPDEPHGRHSDTLDRPTTKAARGHAEPTLVASRNAGPIGGLGDGNTASATATTAAAWSRSTVQAAPRRTAVLRQFRVERRTNGEASSVMAGEVGRSGDGWVSAGVRGRWWLITGRRFDGVSG
jgi:hypothetical protein